MILRIAAAYILIPKHSSRNRNIPIKIRSVYIKYKLSSAQKNIKRYAVGYFAADCSTGRQPSRYFMIDKDPKNTVNKDIAEALPKNPHNSIEFDPSTMGYSNGYKSDWDIDF